MFAKDPARLAARLCVAAFLTVPVMAFADTYPFDGKWTYENAAAGGPAKDCGKHFTEFKGTRRLEKGGSVPDYRNVRAEKSGNEYRLTDEIFNGQVRGQVKYTLQKRDESHIEMRMSDKTFQLRRCD